MNKFILLILLFPLASKADSEYNKALGKIGEILYNESELKKDLDYRVDKIKNKTPTNIRKSMEVIVPTVMGLIEHKFELRYVKEF